MFFDAGLFEVVDKSLMQEAISQNVLAADSLKSAYERIRQAGSIQLAKTELARAVARDTKISLMEEYIRQSRLSSGCSANEELSRAYRTFEFSSVPLHQLQLDSSMRMAMKLVEKVHSVIDKEIFFFMLGHRVSNQATEMQV
ncbi:hypothetical protein E4U57_004680 [Claviceps arundinis]|uniref:Uncharacterized protein n=1 Tax=Claviceps arundinis TaxID=1623583 RepID=A0ABQ7P4N7_9HYPO|nr:hypothetical protein E4U57_004680 [Claviceps arundinis]